MYVEAYIYVFNKTNLKHHVQYMFCVNIIFYAILCAYNFYVIL